MASAAEQVDLEQECPWLRDDFRAGLASLSDSTAEAARRFAADVRVLADLARQVPRAPMDDRGATPWTSFRREVAVARRLSDRGAAAEIRAALALTQTLPRTLGMLTEGRITVQRARTFISELESVDSDVAQVVDAQLAERIALLPPWRIVQEARRAVLTADPEDAARRAAQHNDARSVSLQPAPDDQAAVVLTGPAVPLTRYWAGLDQRARALKAAGDPRTLDQLRFDLAVTGYPCSEHRPSDSTTGPLVPDPVGSPADFGPRDAGSAGLRPSGVEPASHDCRMSRPVQASITVPVETALGLSNEPAWLDGYGWLSAPTARQLLVDAELRRVCVQAGTGQVVDVAERDVRPPPTYSGLRQGLLDMVVSEMTLSGAAGRSEDQHDPTPALRGLVELRDRFDDGPAGTRAAARTCDLDHDTPFPQGPTAAWNLVARARRTHQLKHFGWTPLRTPTSTFWFTLAGQALEVPRHLHPPPGIDHGELPGLPDPEDLALTDLAALQPLTDADYRPWLTGLPRDQTE